ncbi:hypothetical protein HY480_04550 [Candidatus Uhrbacteria bacterium]|nr:hypothetical protein [Candidatus Uhrbacteria bacterium]
MLGYAGPHLKEADDMKAKVFGLTHGWDKFENLEKRLNAWLASNPGDIKHVVQASTGWGHSVNAETIVTVFYEPNPPRSNHSND